MNFWAITIYSNLWFGHLKREFCIIKYIPIFKIELRFCLTHTIFEWNSKFKITVHHRQIAQSNLKCVGYYTLFYLKLPNNSFTLQSCCWKTYIWRWKKRECDSRVSYLPLDEMFDIHNLYHYQHHQTIIMLNVMTVKSVDHG